MTRIPNFADVAFQPVAAAMPATRASYWGLMRQASLYRGTTLFCDCQKAAPRVRSASSRERTMNWEPLTWVIPRLPGMPALAFLSSPA